MVNPLEGIKILDLSIAVAAPFGATMLADLGAEVIKVERIQGEAHRIGLPAGVDDVIDTHIGEDTPDAIGWSAVNRGKRGLAIDIRTDKGRDVILKLVKDVDVVVQSFRPGVADRLGVGYEALSRINPKIIYCSFTGYGETGPLAHRAGGDMWSQAISGMISINGFPGGPPQMIPFPVCDNVGGMLVAYAIMTALFVRERTGISQEVTVNNLDAALYVQYSEFASCLTENRKIPKTGRSYFTPPFGPIQTKDGAIMTIFGTDPMWPTFCKMAGIEHLANDPRFATDEARRQNREEIGRLLDEAFSKKTRAEWQLIFKENKMRCDPCLTHEEVATHPQLEANNMIVSVEHPPRGALKMLGLPIKLKKTPGNPQSLPPALGQHTAEILQKLGYSADEINTMESEKVIRVKRK